MGCEEAETLNEKIIFLRGCLVVKESRQVEVEAGGVCGKRIAAAMNWRPNWGQSTAGIKSTRGNRKGE